MKIGLSDNKIYAFIFVSITYRHEVSDKLKTIGRIAYTQSIIHNNVLNINNRMEAAVVAPTTAVVFLKEGEPGYLDQILIRLCALTDEETVKEGNAKGSSSFKLATLKQIAKNMPLVSGLAEPEMIQSLRKTANTTEVLRNAIAPKRDGTDVTDKNTYRRLNQTPPTFLSFM